MPYSRDVRSTLHGLLYTKPNLSLWGFTMPKGFGIGQHIREKPGTSKFTRTFGHPVYEEKEGWGQKSGNVTDARYGGFQGALATCHLQ